MGQQPLHWPRTGMGEKLVHLRHLLGDMNVDRGLGPQAGRKGQSLRRHRPQGMGRHAQHGIPRQGRQMRRRAFQQPGKAVWVIAKAHLPRPQRPPVKAAALVKHRKQGQAQPRLLCRRHDTPRHFGKIVISHA